MTTGKNFFATTKYKRRRKISRRIWRKIQLRRLLKFIQQHPEKK